MVDLDPAAAAPDPAPDPDRNHDDVIDHVRVTLLRAASEVLATEGPAALTVRRIARAAGESTMNVYSRFGGKEGVVEHLYIEGFTRLRNAMTDDAETDDPLLDLVRSGQAYRRFALTHPTYYAVMFDGVVPLQPSPAAVEHASGTLRLLADRLHRAMDTGLLAPADPMTTAAGVWAACHGVVSLERKAVGPPGLDWTEVYDRTCAALLAGLAHGHLPGHVPGDHVP
jgi:AcrR family transcriptional regulator